MGLFDFLKKKEFDQIKKLTSELDACRANSKNEIDRLHRQLERYSALSSIENEVENKKIELDTIIFTKQTQINAQKDEFDKLKEDYQSSIEIYKKLRNEVSVFENKLDLIEFGVYTPVYDFEKSEDYRQAQNDIVEKLKWMLQADSAAFCRTTWTIEGSQEKGRAVVNVYKKLMLRAFNGESDVMIAKVKWNNIKQMKERMNKAFIAINKLGEGFQVSISHEYFKLKEAELVLEYEFQAKKQQEKEAMKAIQEELREEEKARRDFEKAQKEAEKQESMYQKALDKVRKEFEKSNGINAEALQNQIAQLEEELKEAQEKKERALSMAQQTKRGYVYIISNIGAFGENTYKIGMTRRLEPMDRVKELGDASVPFPFDVHAMIYSDEARTLEYELHKAFAHKKVNMMNFRKEFFNVTLEEIEQMIQQLGFNAEFTILPEAMEYRETLTILEKLNNVEDPKTLDDLILDEFPMSLATTLDEE